jgi:dihydroflavonol-4-reductase
VQVLVTGASGHLGNVLVRELLARGRRVRALVLPGDPARALTGLDVERVEGDVTAAETLDRAFAGVEVVFHAAGLIGLEPQFADRLEGVNVQGTRHVIAACRRADVRRLVYTSSAHALAHRPAASCVTEGAGFDPGAAVGAYGRSKSRASRAVLEAADTGLESIVLCPTGLVGPWDYVPSQFGRFLQSCLAGRMRIGIRGGFDYVDVRDVAEAHVRAGEDARTGGTYVLSGEYISMRDVFAVVEETAGVPAPAVMLPYTVARPLAWLAWRAIRLLGRPTSISPGALDTLNTGHRYSSTRARRELGFAPRPARDALVDAIRWLQEGRSNAGA